MKNLLVLGLSILCGVNLSFGKDWRGLVPLISTRTEVERLLGPKEERDIVRYDLKDKQVMIWYSKGSCGSTPDADWNVPINTVTSIHIYLKKPVRLASLSLDFSKVEKMRGDADLSDHFYYINKEEGFGIEVQNLQDGRGEIVTGYLYGPRLKDRVLKCKKSDD
jgi:hypothetical protein